MKRSHNSDNDSDSSSDDDFGPSPELETTGSSNNETEVAHSKSRKKRVKRDAFEKLYLDNLPSCDFYEKSYMHRDIVTHIAISKQTDFIITGSRDGHVKFWKKMLDSIEFVKHFQAHLGPLTSLSLSYDGQKLSTTSLDKSVKFFEVLSFDLSNMFDVSFVPSTSCWLSGVQGIYSKIAIADRDDSIIRIFRSDGSGKEIASIACHTAPVRLEYSYFYSLFSLKIISCIFQNYGYIDACL